MKRKTNIKHPKEKKKHKTAPPPLQLVINLTEDQYKSIKRLSDLDNQETPDIWASKALLRIVADRYIETR